MMSPCRYCENRHWKCHSNCEAYGEFRAYLDHLKERISSIERTDADVKAVLFEHHAKQKTKAIRYK